MLPQSGIVLVFEVEVQGAHFVLVLFVRLVPKVGEDSVLDGVGTFEN